MTPQQIALVTESWSKVLPTGDAAAAMFYERLFELDPSLQGLFKSDMSVQGGKLIAMISAAVGGANNLDSIVPAVQELGRRHVRYGVQDSHYDTVGAALIWTLEQGLGESFTDDVRTAWVDIYTLLAGVMKQVALAG